MDLTTTTHFHILATGASSAANPPLSLLATLPDELILYILKFLDVPELYALTKTSRHLRSLSTDPFLHLARLKTARQTLNVSLPHRPSLDDIQRSGRIYLTRRQVTQRSLSRSLTLIRLNRKLSNRPSIPYLIERGVLPVSYYRKSEDGAALWEPVGIAPALLGTAKELEEERIKNRLRGWVGSKRPSLVDAERVGGSRAPRKEDRARG